MSERRRIKITHVHRASAHYKNRASIIGLTGMFEPVQPSLYPGYVPGSFYPDGKGKDNSSFFLAIRYRRI